jgi:hypothetical protein
MKHIKKIFLFFFLLSTIFYAKAQINLVLNPSFENYKYCPNLNAHNSDDAFVAWNWNQHDSIERGTASACLPELYLKCTLYIIKQQH